MSSAIFALIPAAGSGSRFGSGIPKQFTPLLGKTILERTLDAIAAGLTPSKIFIALSPNDTRFASLQNLPNQVVPLYCGGATRAETVLNALNEMATAVAPDATDWIAVHDAARCCVPVEALKRLKDWILAQPDESEEGALLAMPVSDTVKAADASGERVAQTRPRDGLWLAQTPQCFRYRVLREALTAYGASATDEASAIEKRCAALNAPMPRLIRGDARNIKVTYGEDLEAAERILRRPERILRNGEGKKYKG